MPNTLPRALSPARLKIFFFWLLLVCGILVFAVISAETHLQLREYARARLQFSMDSNFELNPFLQISPKPNPEHKINEDSFRGEPLDLSDDTYRIFVFGGSTTLSMLLPYEDSYPAKLEKKLREHYPGIKIQVQNTACDWYSTQHSIILYLFKVRYFKPNAVIVMHGINDLFRSFASDALSPPDAKFKNDYSHFLGPMAPLNLEAERYFPFRHFLFPEWLRHKLNPTTIDQPKPARIHHFKSLSIFEENLKLFAKLTKLNGQPMILLSQPNIYQPNLSQKELQLLYFGKILMSEKGTYPDLESLEYGMRLYNHATRRVAETTNIPFVDVEAKIPKNGTYFSDDVHPLEPATEIEASMLADEIIRQGWIPAWSAARQAAKGVSQ